MDGLLRISLTGKISTVVDDSHYEANSGLDVVNNKIYVKPDSSSDVNYIRVYNMDGIHINSFSQPIQVDRFSDFKVLPGEGFAIFDNTGEKVYFLGPGGGWIKTFIVSDSSDNRYQDMDGIVVDNKLIIASNQKGKVISFDLTDYEQTEFADLSSLSDVGKYHITYYESKYYIYGTNKIYLLLKEGNELIELAELPENNIVGMAIIQNTAYAAVNFSGEIYKVNLETGESEVFVEDLEYPKALAINIDYDEIPEFPSWIILPLFLIVTLSSIMLKKTLLRQRS